MKVDYKPSRRYAEYVRKIACDDWEPAGIQGNDKALLRHRPTGSVVAYCLHDGGNDWNGPRNFALEIQRLCGCRLIEPRGRKRSRKAVRASGFSLDHIRPNEEARNRAATLADEHASLAHAWESRDPGMPAGELLNLVRRTYAIERALADAYQPVVPVRVTGNQTAADVLRQIGELP